MILLFLLLFIPVPLSQDIENLFIVWNVGQGATSTLVKSQTCTHIDLGGEQFPKKLESLCAHKNNIVLLTHFDSDHMNFISRARKIWPKLCLTNIPPTHLSARKKRWLSLLPRCALWPKDIQKIGRPHFAIRNESQGYVVAGKILITGDASRSQEKLFVNEMKPDRIRVLLAGHHGSRTSTGKYFLEHLKNLKLVVVSARKKKYGHPHKETKERLKTAAVPWLDTESYGHITFPLSNL